MKAYNLKAALILGIILLLAIACSSESGSSEDHYTSSSSSNKDEFIYSDGNDNDGYILTFGGNDDDKFESIIGDADGNYIIVGTTESYGSGEEDVWILKFNLQGEVLWQKTHGSIDDDWVNYVLITSKNDYIIIGTTRIALKCGLPNIHAQDTDTCAMFVYSSWILKLNEQGEFLWEKTCAGPVSDIQITPEGSYVIAGDTDGPEKFSSSYKCDAWVLKLNKQGDILWEKTYAGADNFEVKDIQTVPEGGYIVVGEISYFTFDLSIYAWLLRLDEQGEVLWEKTYNLWLHDIQIDPEGGYIAVGTRASFFANDLSYTYINGDARVLKLDDQGELLWEKTFDKEDYEWALSVKPIPGEGYVISGEYQELLSPPPDILYSLTQPWLFKLDLNGEMIWQKKYSIGYGDNNVENFLLTPSGGFFLVGKNDGVQTIQDDRDLSQWIAKLDKDGELIGKTEYLTAGYDFYISNFESIDQNSYAILGNISDSITPKAYEWITILSSEGDIIWDKRYVFNESASLRKIIKNPNGGYIVVGSYGDYADSENPDDNMNGLVLFIDAEGNYINPNVL